MRPEVRGYLSEIRSSANEILEIGGLTGESYLSSRRDALAIERLFEIIGEALVRIREMDPRVFEKITDAPAVVGM
jgi:uncharacterized protein with HEPN domain